MAAVLLYIDLDSIDPDSDRPNYKPARLLHPLDLISLSQGIEAEVCRFNKFPNRKQFSPKYYYYSCFDAWSWRIILALQELNTRS